MTDRAGAPPPNPWIMAARPATLPAAVGPVLIGASSAWRDGEFALLPFVVVLFCALAIQVGVNYANDLADAEKGADTEARIGPVRAVSAGMITAGKFLEKFTDYPFIHLDIAGPAFIDKNEHYQSAGGTGIGVRLLTEFFKSISTK